MVIKELRHLNDCRMHLHALRLSDICTADGRYLTNNAMEVQLIPIAVARSLGHTGGSVLQPLTLALGH
jgi:hypothetical protein